MAKRIQSNTTTSDNIDVAEETDIVDVPPRHHEVIGVIFTILGLVTFLALISYDGLNSDGSPVEGENITGLLGMWSAYALFSIFGQASYIVNLSMWFFAAMLFTGHANKITFKGVAGVSSILIFSAIALHTILGGEPLANGHVAGGTLGSGLGNLLIMLTSTAGTYIITFGGIILTLILVTDISIFLIGRTIGLFILDGAAYAGDFALRVVRAWKAELPNDDNDNNDVDNSVENDNNDKKKDKKSAKKKKSKKESLKNKDKKSTENDDVEKPVEPKIVTTAARTKKKSKPEINDLPKIEQTIHGEFTLPGLTLLAKPDEKSINIDKAYLQITAEKLVAVLKDFKISGEVKEIHPGPVVTMFEFQPTSGTKLSKIGGLSNEIAMALEVFRVRIVAPIPGKNAVGFELPNKEREMVRLREIFEDDSFAAAKGKLPMALGKDIAGMPFTVDLAKMPHLLMAGTTGSGKSVSVNTMLLSLLYRYTPDDLRLLLIDPKMIEFQPYNHIPHLLLPVVTDMSQANLALKWAVDEMERRYQLFSDNGSKNLESYNQKIRKILAEAQHKIDNPLPSKTIVTPDGAIVDFGEEDQRLPERLPEELPLIVICIDELADLMMVAAKDVENSIARLAQKARASGIHLIVATQRPSTDVVTGLIKANFPARLSCQVSSGIDSRTILGTGGAENLLGNGDMLIIPPGRSDPQRVQGAFVSEEEVVDVVEFLKQQRTPEYDEEILIPREEDGASDIDDEEKDVMYDQAVAIVAEAQTCSISMLQRKLRIGYNRSARIVEIMEKEGVVGPPNGSNKREVLISSL